MRLPTLLLLGLVGGFLTGIVLAEIIGIVGFVTVGGVASLRWVRLLPFVLPFVGAGLAVVVDRRRGGQR